MNAYVCIHVLQDVPPANLNRDDNGTPKQALYGGVERLRVSSQAWKRATRKHFESSMEPVDLGVRTRRLHGLLAESLKARGMDEDRVGDVAAKALAKIEIKADKRNPEYSSYLLFVARRQLDELADLLAAAEGDVDAVDVASALGSAHSLDVALFGRMVADLTMLNVDAAAQVAHAISTHSAKTQFDYFTAVDDEQDKDEAGAGMIGTVGFNSGTLYRYAAVGLEQLVDNMGDREAAVAGIGRFVESFVLSMPTGKQNTFAAHTRPGLVLVEVRDAPLSYVSAFESPVTPRAGQGFMAASQQRLAEFRQSEVARWGDEPRLGVASYAARDDTHRDDADLEGVLGVSQSLSDLLDAVTAELASGGGDD